MPELNIEGRHVGPEYDPFVIAEIGINHEGDIDKAFQMVDDAYEAGCECVKFQCHVVEDEMIPNNVVPGNAEETIWEIMSRCALSEEEHRRLKDYAESCGMIYLCTPFSRAAVDRLARLQVSAFKIGSGECNNFPLVKYIANFGKPVILSTGMNDLHTIEQAVAILREQGVQYAVLHCTSMYPTPYEKLCLQAVPQLAHCFEDAVTGFSDHSLGNYAAFASIALGGSIVEKHFTHDKLWPGPDNSLSIQKGELTELIQGTRAVHRACRSGGKSVLPDEQPTINFAHACVVSIRDISAGETLTEDNIWVKRPGTGEIPAQDYEKVLGTTAREDIPKDRQIQWNQLAENK